MTREIKIGLVAVMMVFVIAMVWLMGGNGQKPASKRVTYVSSNWDGHYKLKDKRPYGLYLFNSLLHAHIDSSKKIMPVTNGVNLDSMISEKSTMLFIGDQFGLQNNELDVILTKVSNGSDLFISFNELTENIYERLFDKVEISYDYADSVNVFIGKNRLTQYYLYQNDTLAHQWKAFYAIQPKDAAVYRSLSSFMEMSNLVRINYGKGYIFLHTNPEFFFNYQLKREDGYRFTSFALNKISKEQDVYLLELGRLLDKKDAEEEPVEEEKGGKQDDSYLQFLLKSPALMAAMTFAVLGLFLFLFFRAKRMQPTVPLIPKKKNMSLEFVDTITSIYLAKQYPYGLLQVQKKNFYDLVFKHFFVDLSRSKDDRENDLEILSQKSNVPVAELKDLLRLLETKVKINVTDDYIVETAKKQRNFYEQTGVIHTKILEKVSELKGTINREIFLSSIMVLLGCAIIMTGFYFLVKAIGVGILLWPLGAAILTIGILRLSKPLLKFDSSELVYFPLIGKKQRFKMQELLTISPMKNGATIHFTEQRKITIYYSQMSRFDKTQFEMLIAKNHQFEV